LIAVIDQAGTEQLDYIPRAREGVQGAALWAYCRELCGPGACDRAVTTILRALEDEPGSITEDELLLVTRAIAARFTSPATDAYRCADTAMRLAAWAGDELDSDERDELREHLTECLPCRAIKVKMDRAERGFTTLFARSATLEPQRETLAADAAPAVDLRSEHAKAAVRAYCRELCGPVGSRRAVSECIAAAGIEARSATVGEDRLLRLTRVAAAKQALIDADGQLDRGNPSGRRNPECAMTPTLLASAANGRLEPVEQLELERHVEQCLVCQASRIKMDRAERAFATLATAAAATEPEYVTRPAAPARVRPEPPREAAARPAPVIPDPPREAAAREAARPDPPREAAARPAPVIADPLREAARPEPRRGAAKAATARPVPRRRTRGAMPPSLRRLRARRLIAVVGALVLAAVAAAAVLAAGGAFSTMSTPSAIAPAAHAAPVSPAAATGASAAAATTITHHPAAKLKAKPARHRAPAKAHRAAKPRRAAKPKHTAAPVVAAAPTPAATPAPSRAPVSAPVASKPVSAAPVKPSTPSVTPQGTNLPAQSAPTQGISSGG
jgi:hypothetical protein